MCGPRLTVGALFFLAVGNLCPGQQPAPFTPPSPAAELLPPNGAPPSVPPGPAGGLVPLQPRPNQNPPTQRELNAGVLVGVELALITPRLGGSIPGGSLDQTVAPTFLIGYRFPSGRSIQLEYRYFGGNQDTTTQFGGDPGPIVIHQHVEGNIFDLNVRFLQREWPLWFRTQWELGARDANVSVYAQQPSPTQFMLVSNRFIGAGPHANWRLSWALFETGLELFGSSDLAVLFGTNQGSSQQQPNGVIPATPISHTASGRVAYNGRWQLGGSFWFDWGRSRVVIISGYEVDAYSFTRAGAVTAVSNFMAPPTFEAGSVSLLNQGWFLRVEVKY